MYDSANGSGLSISLRSNSLPAIDSKWYTEPTDFNIVTKTVEADSGVSDTIKISLSYDSLPTREMGRAELLTDIDII